MNADNTKAMLSNQPSSKARKPFNLRLWFSQKWDEIQGSLFFSPCLAVLTAIGLAIGLTYLDERLTEQNVRLPVVFETTVDSARSVLSTVASATISFAGTAFSLSLLVFQLSSSQYSPRIITTLFRDPYNRRVIAFTVGTFTYCLVVMRAVGRARRQDEEDRTINVVPYVSVNVAVLLGIVSILSIVAFIDHTAHSIDISELLHKVDAETVAVLSRSWLLPSDVPDDIERHGSSADESDQQEATEHWKEVPDAHIVRFRQNGWVQELNLQAIKSLVPKGGFIKIHTSPGRYALPGSAVCSVSGLDITDETDLDEFDTQLLDAVALGRSRTMRDDPSFGLRQLVDVSLRALSPGINDPTTAQDAVFHAAAIVIEFLKRDPPPAVIKTDEEGGELILGEQQTHDGIVSLAYNEIRICAASSPTVGLYLIESLRLIRESLTAAGLKDRAPEIERQVQLIEANCRQVSSHIYPDHQFIAKARMERFPQLMPLPLKTYSEVASPE